MSIAGGPDIVENGLVLHLDAADTNSYPGSGTVWTDLSGNGNNGTLTNGPTFGSANKGSIVFDGTNDRVSLSSSFTNNYIDITVSCIIYITNTTSLGIIISKYYGGFDGWEIYYDTSISKFIVGGRIQYSSYHYNDTTNTFSTNKWYHVVFTRQVTNWRLYINSVLERNNTNSGNGTLAFNNNAPFFIGEYSLFSLEPYPYKGNISQVLIYNRALSASEILQNYNATKGRYGL